MSERYLVTGVQLGMLSSELDLEKRKQIVEDIIDTQFINNSKQHIYIDCQKLRRDSK